MIRDLPKQLRYFGSLHGRGRKWKNILNESADLIETQTDEIDRLRHDIERLLMIVSDLEDDQPRDDSTFANHSWEFADND